MAAYADHEQGAADPSSTSRRSRSPSLPACNANVSFPNWP